MSVARVAFLIYLGAMLGLVALVLDKLAHGLTVTP